MGLEGAVRSLVLWKKLNRSIVPAKSCFLMQDDPDYWSAVLVRTERVLRLLTSTWQSHVSL